MLDVRCLFESSIVAEGEPICTIESMLPKSNLELILTSKRIELVGEATSLQALLCPIEPPDDLFCGFAHDMVFNSDLENEEECHLLNTSSVCVVVANVSSY